MHPLPIDTHGPSSLLWTLLLTPYCLNCFRAQEKPQQELVTLLEGGESPPTGLQEQQNTVCSETTVRVGKELAFKTQQKLLFVYVFFSPAVGLWEILNSSTKALAICCIYSELLPVLVICTPFR